MLSPEHENNSRKFSWTNLFITISTLAIAAVAAKIPGNEWIAILCVPLLLVSLALHIANSPVSSYIKKRWNCFCDRKLLSRNLDCYLEFIERIEIGERLLDQLQHINWNNGTPLHTKSSFKLIGNLAKHYSIQSKKYSIFINVNCDLERYINYTNTYLRAINASLNTKLASFGSDHHKEEVKRLLVKYQDICDQHDDFCRSINKKLRTTFLARGYSADIVFV